MTTELRICSLFQKTAQLVAGGDEQACITYLKPVCILRKMQIKGTPNGDYLGQACRHSDDRVDYTSAAARVQRRLQKLTIMSLHWKTGAPSLSMDLAHSLHAGLQPLVDVSLHAHIGGSDLVQTPHSSQHGHRLLLASTPSSSCAAVQ